MNKNGPITILRRPPESTTEKTGVGAYSDRIEEGLKERGIEFNRITIEMDPKRTFKWRLMNSLIYPIITSIRSKGGIFHATDESCCLSFPLLRGRRIMTVHHILRKEDNSPIYVLAWRIITRIGFLFAHDIVATSSFTKSELVEFYGIPERKIKTIFTSINPVFKTLDLPRERMIGVIGTLTERKNVQAAILAFSKFIKMPGVEDFRLKICGKGPSCTELKEMTVRMGLEEKVEFVSNFTEEEVVTFYNTISVLANPSMLEGVGLVTLEAQKCSAPVVFFKDALIPEEVTRFAVPSSDIDDFVNNIYRLITDKNHRDAVVSEGKRYADMVGENFIDELMDLYGYDKMV